MNAGKTPSVESWRDHHARRVSPFTARVASKQDAGRRRGCGDVARNRAARYARKRRIPKPLWPLIAAVILIWMIFDRRAPVAVSRIAGRLALNRATMAPATISGPDVGWDIVRLAASGDTGSAIEGNPEPQYRPSSDFLLKDVAQALAFVIRNRGRLDTDTVRAKWDLLDRVSLPLAVYMREVEAKAGWNDLEKEIAATPPGAPAISKLEIPKSPRHRKLLRLMPEWSRRGEDLLSGLIADDTMAVPAPGRNPDPGPDQEPPKP